MRIQFPTTEPSASPLMDGLWFQSVPPGGGKIDPPDNTGGGTTPPPPDPPEEEESGTGS